MRTCSTPLQRTRRKRAAERVLLACGPFRHAACGATRAPSLRRCGLDRHRAGQQSESQALRAGLRSKARRASSPPGLGSRSGVNRLRRFNITESSAKLRQSLAKLAWCRNRSACGSAPFGFAEVRLCLAPLRVCRAASAARRARKPKHVRSRLRRHRKGSSQRGLRRVCGVEAPAHPGQSAGAGSCRLRRHSLPAPSACPSRPPPQAGAPPKAKTQPPCGASRSLVLHRMRERASSVPRQGFGLRPALTRALDPMKQRAHSTI